VMDGLHCPLGTCDGGVAVAVCRLEAWALECDPLDGGGKADGAVDATQDAQAEADAP
jgi:hypothetical protein